MEEFEKGTPAGVAIESDGHLRQSPGLPSCSPRRQPSYGRWLSDKSGDIFAGTGSPAAVLRLAGQKGEKPFTLFETKDLTVQALRLGPDGSLYAATLPSGKVYKLNPGRRHEAGRNDCPGCLRRRQAGRDCCRPEQGCLAPSAQSHYIWDLTFDSAGRLYIATGNPGAIYRVDLYQARRSAGAVFQERRGAYPRSRMGRQGQPDRRLRRLGAGLPHRPARQGLRALRGAAAGDHRHCHRRQWNHLCSLRGRQEPQSVASTAGAGDVRNHHHRRAAGIAPGSQHQRLGSRGDRNLRPGRGPGAAQALVRQGRDRLRFGCPSRRPSCAQRQSRAHLPHCRKTAVMPTLPICRRSRASAWPTCRALKESLV